MWRKYRHVPLAVIEFIDGPKDTLMLLDKYKKELEEMKMNRKPLWEMELDEMIRGVESGRRGRIHKHHLRKLHQQRDMNHIMLLAGRHKCTYMMERYARYAMGDKSVLDEKEPKFWVQ